MADREEILAALGSKGNRTRTPVAIPPLPQLSNEALWSLFRQRLEELGGRIATLSELEAILARPFVMDVESALRLGRIHDGTPIWDAEVGVTTADLAIAETGSIVFATGLGRPSMASLTPTLHVAIIPKDRIVATVAEAFARMSDRTTVIITGPSRTADIEGILVRGVHGPGDVVVIPV